MIGVLTLTMATRSCRIFFCAEECKNMLDDLKNISIEVAKQGWQWGSDAISSAPTEAFQQAWKQFRCQ